MSTAITNYAQHHQESKSKGKLGFA